MEKQATDVPKLGPEDIEEFKLVVDIWKKAIDVQQHFNDLEMRIRATGVTILTAIFAATAVVLKDGAKAVSIFGNSFSSPAPLIIFAGLVAWGAFYLVDRWWYHRLLHGSVEEAKRIEDLTKDRPLKLNLSHAIGKASPIKIVSFGKFSIEIHTNLKIDLFYFIIGLILVVIMLGML
jgi:hypothetical protein